MLDRPEDLFDRDTEWAQLSDLVDSAAPGMRVGIVSGRRRQGKSYLLRRLTRSAGGFYHQAQEVERTQALGRFATDVARTLGLPAGQLRFTDWEAALRIALGYPERGGTGGAGNSPPAGPNRLLVLDELPYLLTHSSEIPSVLQELHDEARDADLPPAVVIVCGSSLSVMTELLSGTKPLRGRAQLDMTVRPFDFRTAAAYWGIADPHLAFHTHTVFGGTAGYRALVDAPPTADADFPAWIARNVLNPAHALYGEKDYLLREDTRIADKQLYNSILASVASGFLIRVEDMLTPRRPLHFLADPIVGFAEVVIEPYRPLLEEGDAAAAWEHAYPVYSSAVLGPHFEHLARNWTAQHSGDRWGGVQVGEVGPGLVNDPVGRVQHELDVVALPRGVRLTPRSPLLVLGEAKSTNKARTPADLARLDAIRDLLGSQGRDVSGAQLALFSREGFVPELVSAATARSDVHLIDLAEMYT